MSDDEIRHLESFVSFYREGDVMDDLMLEREIELVRATGRPIGGPVLEVGCGSGKSTAMLRPIFPGLEVLEPSAGNIALLRERISGIRCHHALLADFVAPHPYDCVLFLNVIEHVEDPVASLRKLRAILADDGVIYLSAPNFMALNRRAGHLMGLLERMDQLAPKDLRVGHRRLYTRQLLEHHCMQAGLRVLAVKGIYLKPLSEAQMFGLGEAAVRAFLALGEDIPEYCASLLAVATKDGGA